MGYEIRLERVAGRPLAVVKRHAGLQDLSKVVPDACGVVWGVVRAKPIPGAGRNVAVYLDDSISLEIGVELDAPFGGHGEVADSATPSGLAATTTHLGPYGRLGEAHEAIRRWCGDHGHRLAGPCWEVYGHWKAEWDDAPDEITTDIYYLIDEGRPSASPDP